MCIIITHNFYTFRTVKKYLIVGFGHFLSTHEANIRCQFCSIYRQFITVFFILFFGLYFADSELMHSIQDVAFFATTKTECAFFSQVRVLVFYQNLSTYRQVLFNLSAIYNWVFYCRFRFIFCR